MKHPAAAGSWTFRWVTDGQALLQRRDQYTMAKDRLTTREKFATVFWLIALAGMSVLLWQTSQPPPKYKRLYVDDFDIIAPVRNENGLPDSHHRNRPAVTE